MNDDLISDQELRDILGFVKIGSKNHYIASCPFCGKANHFYISRNTHLFDCKKCGEEGNEFKLLAFLGKLHLFGKHKTVNISKIDPLLISEKSKELESLDLSVKTVKQPIGFKRVYENEYLLGRGLTDKDFLKYKIGISNILPSLKDYIIFLIEDEFECKGHVARYTGEDPNKKRYDNSKSTFSRLLFGFDEIIKNITHTVFLVEGIFDKISLDNYLNLNDTNYTKCVCTFGKKISDSQIKKLQQKGVLNIILIYDYDAIIDMKKYSIELLHNFDVKVGYTFDKDINASTKEEVFEIFDRLKNPYEFNKRTVATLK